jgi:hypothetical protein
MDSQYRWTGEFPVESVWVAASTAGGAIFLVVLIVLLVKRYRKTAPGSSPATLYAAKISIPAYPPQVLDKLVLPDTVKGLVGIRQWTWNGSTLTSRNQKFIWNSNKMLADSIPNKSNNYGIYAYQLGSLIPAWYHHIGIVEMLEHIEVHSDGVMRAEKCKILAIIVNWGNSVWATEVSSQYHIPVYISNYPGLAFKRWILGPDGMKWLNHNFNLLNSEFKFNILEEAEKLLGGKR